MADKVLINGNMYDFGSTSLKIDDEPFYGYKGITWNQKRERAKAHGQGKHRIPRGKSRGKYSAECTLTLYRDADTALIDHLASKAADGVSYGEVEFPMVLQYIEEGSNQDPVTIEFGRCHYGGDDNSNEEGGEADAVTITIDLIYIKKNGKTLFDNSDGSV